MRNVIKSYKTGERVKHINHGDGTVKARVGSEGVLVSFDIQPEGWDKEIVVSAECLKKL